MYTISCRRCRQPVAADVYRIACPACGGPLEFGYPDAAWSPDDDEPSLWRYRDLLPVQGDTELVTLYEGWTPLEYSEIECPGELFIKNETRNPTGSHKDRALALAVTKAREFGRDAVMLYSDGSTALASAAYAARAGLHSIVVVGRKVPDYRLLPLVVYGSHVLEFQGSAAEALDWVHEVCQKQGIFETTTYRLANPYSMEGPKTIGYEIFEQLDGVPDWIIVPVGGGATLAGIWQAFVELQRLGQVERLPRMVGVLPEGYEMLATALEQPLESDQQLRALAPPDAPPTIQVKIAMTFPPDGLEAVAAVRQSGGLFVSAADEEAVEGQMVLGAMQGLYAEPSAAVVIVGLEKLKAMKKIKPGELVVAVVTGSGFRETGVINGKVPLVRTPVEPAFGERVIERLLEQTEAE
ncbi:MAG: pyridoxal-phosphate dependent enzyme [Planctomycetia bacterium]|nr:pyridoxal-phosphate dependent enzyme [Planctomycetia bacterium]